MMWKRSKGEEWGGGSGEDRFSQSGAHERRRYLIRDILKAPEVYCSFLISSLKTTFPVCPFTAGSLHGSLTKGGRGLARFQVLTRSEQDLKVPVILPATCVTEVSSTRQKETIFRVQIVEFWRVLTD